MQVLEHGLQGRVHQESGYAVWQESLILVGGTSLTQAQGLQLFHEMSHQESVDGYSVRALPAPKFMLYLFNTLLALHTTIFTLF